MLIVNSKISRLRAATKSAAGPAAFRSPWTFVRKLLRDMQNLLEIRYDGFRLRKEVIP